MEHRAGSLVGAIRPWQQPFSGLPDPVIYEDMSSVCVYKITLLALNVCYFFCKSR